MVKAGGEVMEKWWKGGERVVEKKWRSGGGMVEGQWNGRGGVVKRWWETDLFAEEAGQHQDEHLTQEDDAQH